MSLIDRNQSHGSKPPSRHSMPGPSIESGLLCYLLFLSLCLCESSVKGANRGITGTSNSPYVKLQSVDIDAVSWTDGFWAEQFEKCRAVMIPNMWGLLDDPEMSHAFANFQVAAGLKQGRHRGPAWHDGDFYKWLEAAAFVYGVTKDENLSKRMDRIIEVIGQAQREDGYIHTPVIIAERQAPSEGREFRNRLDFETYNMGHLMTCACVHHRATGKTSLLRIAQRAADFLYATYKRSSQDVANNAICPSHYMGVVELYRTVADPRYLELAKALIDIRDQVEEGMDHNQDRVPFRQQREAVGHAVRANYLYAGVADVYAETGDESLRVALDGIWNDVAHRKMYVTGGTGALYDGASPDGSKSHASIQLVHQAYGRGYQLPNVTAYNESCATIGFALWNWRMLALEAEARYADLLELALYNGVLSAVSLDGRKCFYRNTLRQVDDLPFELRWSDKREPYISCFCCPPNIVRTVAEVAAYVYGVSPRGVWINLYGANVLDTQLAESGALRLRQETEYPWDGTISITIEKAPQKEFSVFLRIPGWADESNLAINGKPVDENLEPGRYHEIRRSWSSGDRIELALPMSVQLLEAHPLVEEARNQVAVRRGPIIYCLESLDLPEDVRIEDVAIFRTVQFRDRFVEDLLGGVVALEAKAGHLSGPDWDDALYRRLSQHESEKIDIQLIPFYAWGNRGDSEMTVWMPLR